MNARVTFCSSYAIVLHGQIQVSQVRPLVALGLEGNAYVYRDSPELSSKGEPPTAIGMGLIARYAHKWNSADYQQQKKQKREENETEDGFKGFIIGVSHCHMRFILIDARDRHPPTRAFLEF